MRHHPAGAQQADPAADLGTLEEAGIARRDILIANATGLHQTNEGDELVEMVGEAIARDYHIAELFYGGQRIPSEVFRAKIAILLERQGQSD